MNRPHRSCHGSIALELWNVTRCDEWQTAVQLVHATGRRTNGGSTYSKLLAEMVRGGALERREVQHINHAGHKQGRPRIEYRRNAEMFYNTRQDARFIYKPWDELPATLQEEARGRWAHDFAWLNWADWLYPLTRGKKYNPEPRLAYGATRTLKISPEEAEEKRRKWLNALKWVVDE